MRDNLDDEQKEFLKIEDNKRKKAKCDMMTLTLVKKNSSGNKEKKERKLCVITWMKQKNI